MALFKFRVLRPKLTDWVEEEGTCIEDAIQNYHYDRVSQTWADNSVGLMVRNEDGSVKEKQWFAVFEDEGGTEFTSRICVTGMWRKGGIPGRIRTLGDVAKELGVELSSLEIEWLYEEDYKR